MRAHFLLFLLLLALLPIQTGKHFWPDWSFVHGIRVDYLSPTLFLTDILIFFIFAFWFLKDAEEVKILRRKGTIFIGFFLLLAFFGLLSFRPQLAFYKLLKLIELILLGFYVSRNIKSSEQFVLALFFLTVGVVWSSLLAWAQFWRQASLSSLYLLSPLVYSFFQLLGERTFDVTMPGIAKAQWDSRLVLRPYATFPHPNALSGFITVVFLLVLVNFPLLTKRKKKWSLIYYLFFIALSLTTVLVTFSRSAWIVCFLATAYWLLVKRRKELGLFFKKRKGLGIFLAALGLVVICFSLPVILPWFQALKTDNSLSVFRRVELAKAAFRMVWSSPIWGIGLGNFTPRLSDFSLNREVVYWLQPVHNIFLLIAAETGLIGLGLFLWFLFRTYLRTRNSLFIIHYSLFIILALGFFDHYFLTLQQTQLLFSLVSGLCWSGIKGEKLVDEPRYS